jgi:hypothetical protein
MIPYIVLINRWSNMPRNNIASDPGKVIDFPRIPKRINMKAKRSIYFNVFIERF